MQEINFIVAGLLTIAFARGLSQALSERGTPSGWGPRLVAVYGLGILGAVAFVTDPLSGYPPGTA
jgi:hypothetical protein